MEEILEHIKELEEEVAQLRTKLEVPVKIKRIEELQTMMSDASFWHDQAEAGKVVDEIKKLKAEVDDIEEITLMVDELNELAQLDDESLADDISTEFSKVNAKLKELHRALLFSGRFDSSDAIVELNSGAGGTESCDWVQMLYRMYTRWSENKKFSIRVLNEVKGDEAGIKNITFMVTGLRAYGLLKCEVGVHRLVRISPFDSNKRRHTSFASVDVVPDVADELEIKVNPDDLKIDTYRSSGAGGQHVNTTDSAVRITHIPTGIVVTCQNERSQHQNRLSAMKILTAKLYRIEEEKQKAQMQSLSGSKQRIEWGSQIRSYVLHPYLMVKDHRTGHEVPTAKDVLDGNIDSFIYAYLESMIGNN
ncbi:MAG: peptide chain release factor 2 [Candidatus Omnitrophica bacterium]|nr:peptide chain release factor 2 [Candidatus Omnitrophota bacterium]MDD5081521.1 peptide chain release factor 2 [Candidatus Omnitrophota bacterium]